MEQIKKLKISSKKLQSGKCQVKFCASLSDNRERYGYILVEPGSTLREVVIRIIKLLMRGKNAMENHLYSVGVRKQVLTEWIFNHER